MHYKVVSGKKIRKIWTHKIQDIGLPKTHFNIRAPEQKLPFNVKMPQ